MKILGVYPKGWGHKHDGCVTCPAFREQSKWPLCRNDRCYETGECQGKENFQKVDGS